MVKTDLLLPNGRNWDLVPISSIQYIESNLKLCKVVTTSRVYLVSASLQSFEARLPKTKFIRIHKSYIIALGCITSIGRSELSIAGRSLPVSRRLTSRLNQRFERFN